MANVRKIYQMEIKYTNIFHCKALQNSPKSGFWLENIPSGNPLQVSQAACLESTKKFLFDCVKPCLKLGPIYLLGRDILILEISPSTNFPKK
jgi:hypothetical protein